MRIAIISDIHGNRQALESVIEVLDRQSVDEIWSPGDFVNYGADPQFVMEWTLPHVRHAVLGNHDAVIVGKETPEYFNVYAREAIPYTQSQLNQESLDWLAELPMDKVVHGIRLVHASPLQPTQWTYILANSQALALFDTFEERICLFGHTHVQVVYDSEGNQYFEGTVDILENRKYLINPGSVGQPRDGDPRWACALYDTEEHTVELLRGKYDIETAAKSIFDAGLPERLGYRLYQGQ